MATLLPRAPLALLALLGAATAALPSHGDEAQPQAPAAKAAPAAKSAPAATSKKAKPPPPPPLEGTTYDYEYDGADVGHKERGWLGRAFVHHTLENKPAESVPVLVFLHGMNTERIKYRWMGGGQEGDVRRIVAELIESGQIGPVILAAPSTTDISASNAVTLWPSFDLDGFLDRTAARLAGIATIDRRRVIVAGHSGAGCNIHGGLATALKAKTVPLAGLVIDTCMLSDFARDLAHVAPSTHLIISWQSISWDNRYFDDFRRFFKREVAKAPPPEGILRELDYQQPREPSPHDAMVGITLKKWLPRFVPPPAKSAGGADG